MKYVPSSHFYRSKTLLPPIYNYCNLKDSSKKQNKRPKLDQPFPCTGANHHLAKSHDEFMSVKQKKAKIFAKVMIFIVPSKSFSLLPIRKHCKNTSMAILFLALC